MAARTLDTWNFLESFRYSPENKAPFNTLTCQGDAMEMAQSILAMFVLAGSSTLSLRNGRVTYCIY